MTTKPEDDPALAAWLRSQEQVAQLLAHDMRNPLQAVIANASFLDDGFRPSEQEARETVSDIRSSAEVLLRLIENVVAIARLESPDTRAIPRRAVALQSSARVAIERCVGTAAASSVRIDLQCPAGVGVLADQGFVEAMIYNLAINGVQHSRRNGQVTVKVEPEASRVAVTLVDDGPHFGAVAEHFTREAQLAIKLQSSGRYSRGMGLYLVGLVAEVFDGSIEPSREGTRSALRVWLPSAV